MITHRFPRSAHLRSSKDFERIYSLRCKAADGVLLIFIARNTIDATRIGLSVSRKHGGAVARNRLKRLLREAFRLEQSRLPKGVDLIAIPLAADRSSLLAFRNSLNGLVKRLSRRLDRPAPSGESSS